MIYIRIVSVLLYLSGAMVFAADIAFEPNTKTAAIGDTFQLAIVGSSFPETEGGGANISFDPNLLQVNSVIVDSTVWDVFASSGSIDNLNGKVDGITVAAFSNPGADFTVATIEFEAIGPGTTALVLSENPLNLWASAGQTVHPTFTNGSVNILNFVPGDGDLAPRGAPDGTINAGDYLVALQIALGRISPTEVEILHGDIYPPSQGDGVIDASDLIFLHTRILMAQ